MKSFFRRSRSFPTSLKIACVGFSLIIIGELFANISPFTAAPETVSAVLSKKPIAPVAELPFSAWVDAIEAHPLFTPDRQAPPVAAAAPLPSETPPEIPGRLAGLMINLGIREALFARDGERPVAVREGDDIHGWTVRSIGNDHVVLKSRFGEQTLEPTKGAGAVMPAPASPGPKHPDSQG